MSLVAAVQLRRCGRLAGAALAAWRDHAAEQKLLRLRGEAAARLVNARREVLLTRDLCAALLIFATQDANAHAQRTGCTRRGHILTS